jgi:hypothetical protein
MVPGDYSEMVIPLSEPGKTAGKPSVLTRKGLTSTLAQTMQRYFWFYDTSGAPGALGR